ncbi:MAG: 4'-phosphopantetheinyl transferase superfamily protein [Bacteroidales bacterium]|jgi:phosphopantetheine--protein transferase-like protein|nr:4'-phosphopantetheinyl transferase superfamily protein [Bacteroidales bacterium]MDD4215001.1 4'-phosphopantetheinyl transferase superfamily protein [Bacteroidales bacterium]
MEHDKLIKSSKMPVFFINQIDKSTKIGVWHITETSVNLMDNYSLCCEEKSPINDFVHENRKKHWLSYRLLLRQMIPDSFNIEYDYTGKPLITKNKEYEQVSISHSGEFAAVIISNRKKVGIDIEKISKRIEKVAAKFLCNEEQNFMNNDLRLDYLCVSWSAKEALYKVFGADFYDFANQMLLKPFSLSDTGVIDAQLKNEGYSVHCLIHYQKIQDYFLSYVIC